MYSNWRCSKRVSIGVSIISVRIQQEFGFRIAHIKLAHFHTGLAFSIFISWKRRTLFTTKQLNSIAPTARFLLLLLLNAWNNLQFTIEWMTKACLIFDMVSATIFFFTLYLFHTISLGRNTRNVCSVQIKWLFYTHRDIPAFIQFYYREIYDRSWLFYFISHANYHNRCMTAFLFRLQHSFFSIISTVSETNAHKTNSTSFLNKLSISTEHIWSVFRVWNIEPAHHFIFCLHLHTIFEWRISNTQTNK